MVLTFKKFNRQPDPATILPGVKSPPEESDPSKVMSDDGQNFLKMELDGNDYLTYLYLGMNETRLAGGEEQHPTASASAGDQQMTHPPSKDDDDIIIGSPTTINFDPYLSRTNQSFRSKSSGDQPFPQVSGDHDRQQTMTANIITSLDEDWLPIASPWDKYGNKSEPKLQ